MLCQKLMLRQIECSVQNRPIIKKGVLPVTPFLFRKFCFSLGTWYKELIWCTNHPKVHIHTFRKRWSFIRRYIFPVSIVKYFNITIDCSLLFTGKFREYLFTKGVLINHEKTNPWNIYFLRNYHWGVDISL